MTSLAVDDTSRPRYGTEAYVLAIAMLTLVGLLLRLTFFNGPVGSDDIRYFNSAQIIVHGGRITVLDHATSRLAFLLLVGAPGALAGSIFVAGYVNVMVSVLTQVVASVFAFREIGPRAGVVTATFLVFDGLTVAYSGILAPDNLLALLTLLCAILLYHATDAPAARARMLYLWAGVAAGAAYSSKDTGILLLVPAVAWTMWQTSRQLHERVILCTVFVAAFVGVWVVEGLFFLARAGDFLYKPHALAAAHNSTMEPAHGVVDFVRRGWWNLSDVSRSIWLSGVPLLVGATCWLRLLWPRRRTTVFALMGGFITVYLFFGTSSFSRLVNLPYQERYLIPVLPCAAIALGDILERWRGGLRTRWLVALAAACLVGGFTGAQLRSGRLYFTEGLRNASIAVNALPNDGRPVLTAAQLRHGMSHYLPRSVARRVHDGRNYPPGVAGYYLTVFRDGAPVIVDSAYVPRSLGTPYLSVAVDQRRGGLWNGLPRHVQDSAVVYIMGPP